MTCLTVSNLSCGASGVLIGVISVAGVLLSCLLARYCQLRCCRRSKARKRRRRRSRGLDEKLLSPNNNAPVDVGVDGAAGTADAGFHAGIHEGYDYDHDGKNDGNSERRQTEASLFLPREAGDEYRRQSELDFGRQTRMQSNLSSVMEWQKQQRFVGMVGENLMAGDMSSIGQGFDPGRGNAQLRGASEPHQAGKPRPARPTDAPFSMLPGRARREQTGMTGMTSASDTTFYTYQEASGKLPPGGPRSDLGSTADSASGALGIEQQRRFSEAPSGGGSDFRRDSAGGRGPHGRSHRGGGGLGPGIDSEDQLLLPAPHDARAPVRRDGGMASQRMGAAAPVHALQRAGPQDSTLQALELGSRSQATAGGTSEGGSRAPSQIGSGLGSERSAGLGDGSEQAAGAGGAGAGRIGRATSRQEPRRQSRLRAETSSRAQGRGVGLLAPLGSSVSDRGLTSGQGQGQGRGVPRAGAGVRLTGGDRQSSHRSSGFTADESMHFFDAAQTADRRLTVTLPDGVDGRLGDGEECGGRLHGRQRQGQSAASVAGSASLGIGGGQDGSQVGASHRASVSTSVGIQPRRATVLGSAASGEGQGGGAGISSAVHGEGQYGDSSDDEHQVY